MTFLRLFLVVLLLFTFVNNIGAGLAMTAFRETAEFIMTKFGKGIAGETVEEIAENTAKIVAKYGDEVTPFLRNSGHTGFEALNKAGDKGLDLLKLYQKRGNEAIWLISDSKRLATFIKYGDSAANAIIKHPGIAESMIEQFGDNAIFALNNLSRQSAQRLSITASEGLFTATSKSKELLQVIGEYGDKAMEFIWKHKRALTVTAVLYKFLEDPSVFISGAKELIISPIVEPIVKSVNWTPIISILLILIILPFIIGRIKRIIQSVKTDTKK